MGNHFTDPIYWFQVALGLVFWLIWKLLSLPPADIAWGRRIREFGQWRFWPLFFGFSAGGASTATIDAEPVAATVLGVVAYFLTGFHAKAGKDEPWLEKNAD